MEGASFGRDSLFGVPLNPILPGMRWQTLREMLHEVLSELHRGWVRRYLFECDGLADATVLSSSTALSNAARFSMNARMDSGGSPAFAVSQSLLLIPARTVDDLGAGVGVEKFDTAVATSLVQRSSRVVRFVVNNRTGASTVTSFNDSDNIELAYHDLRADGTQSHVCLELRRALLSAAFSDPDRLDFSAFERALVSSMVGETSPMSNVTHPRLRTSQYPFRLTMLDGTAFFRNVQCFYKNAVPVSTSAIFIEACGNYNLSNDMARSMTDWAMSYCLERAQPVPQAPMPTISDEEADRGGQDCDDPQAPFVDDLTIDAQILADDFKLPLLVCNTDVQVSWGETESNLDQELADLSNGPLSPLILPMAAPTVQQCAVSAVRIAPAHEPRPIARVREPVEDEKLRKIELRKIRKREAAARCNSRRKAKRLAEQKKLAEAKD